jgi:hypothetical protein
MKSVPAINEKKVVPVNYEQLATVVDRAVETIEGALRAWPTILATRWGLSFSRGQRMCAGWQIVRSHASVRHAVPSEESWGISVVTARTGRFDGCGRTAYPDSSDEYRDILVQLETVPRPFADQTELARRYAYKLFLLGALKFESIKFRYLFDPGASPQNEIGLFDDVPLVGFNGPNTLAAWLADPTQEDLIRTGALDLADYEHA